LDSCDFQSPPVPNCALVEAAVSETASMHDRAHLRVAIVLLTVVAWTAGALAPARAGEIDNLYAQILRHPDNPELNLRFAQLAETSGHLRWALSAYERVVLNDPSNADALQGLTRVRRALQPNTTLLTVQLGAQYESNPRYYLPPRRGEAEALGSAALLDERNLGGIRWRTNAVAAGLVHAREGELDYGVAGAETGPVLDALPGWSFHPAVGGNAAYFDNRFYYGEGAVSGTFESVAQGVYRSVVLRGAYRSYDNFFPSGEGFYVEARGRLAVPGVLGPGTVVIASPFLLWSDISGSASVVTPIATDLQPGAYLEGGGRLDLIKSLASWVVLGVNVSASRRDYRNDLVIPSSEKRRDSILSPGATLTFPDLFAYRTDLRLDYRYLMDRSNDPTKSFNDHIVTASVVARFDPTSPPPWAMARP
jgi:hypothetical protein